MFRKLITAASIAAVGAAAFVGVSWATSPSPSKPDLPSWLPAAGLPTVTVPHSDQIAINNLISAYDVNRYGITTGSFSNARVLTQTELGPLYVIPGTRGVCLALQSPVIACTDRLSQRKPLVVALFVPNSARQLVGGGLVATAGKSISIRGVAGHARVSTHPTLGGFTVSSKDNIIAGAHAKLDLSAG